MTLLWLWYGFAMALLWSIGEWGFGWLFFGCRLFVNGYWLMVIGYWLMVNGYWLMVIGYWLSVGGCLLSVVGCCSGLVSFSFFDD
tara:strand:- start:879 stop:1133 length:255 start_codon:yes stop_codon:yes gene_type:complete